MTLICTMQVKRNSPTSYGQARNILGDDYYLPRQRKKKRQGSRLDALLGHCSSPLSKLRGRSRCQRVTNKITPLYIMSKKGGNCSVNLKKNTKKFFKPLQCRVCPFRYHLYHHAQSVDLQGFTAILRCYGNGFLCFTLDKPLRHKGLRCFSVKSWKIH